MVTVSTTTVPTGDGDGDGTDVNADGDGDAKGVGVGVGDGDGDATGDGDDGDGDAVAPSQQQGAALATRCAYAKLARTMAAIASPTTTSRMTTSAQPPRCFSCPMSDRKGVRTTSWHGELHRVLKQRAQTIILCYHWHKQRFWCALHAPDTVRRQ